MTAALFVTNSNSIMSLKLVSCAILHPFRIPRSVRVIRTSSTSLPCTTRNHNVDHRASSKLFADAEQEERMSQAGTASPRLAVLPGTASEHPNWTGDESVEDAVLRMLVDKYKPLRTGALQTAEEKLHRAPPQVTVEQRATSLMAASEGPSTTLSSHPQIHRVEEPLLPAVEGHKPWLTTFKVPSHATASIRYGRFPAVGSASSVKIPARSSAQTGQADDDRGRRKERDVKKRSEIAGRLTRARESTLDYRLGISKSGGVQARPNPVSIKGWAGLVEERIEVSQNAVRSIGQMLKSRPHFPLSERDCKDTSAPSRAAGSPSRGVTKSTTHSLPVRNSS